MAYVLKNFYISFDQTNERGIRDERNDESKLVIALLVVIAVAIFYYVSLPAINIHATETWKLFF